MVWRDADPAVLRVSVDRSAADDDAAILLGLEQGDHALALSGGAGLAAGSRREPASGGGQ
jgi:hypothetical protein